MKRNRLLLLLALLTAAATGAWAESGKCGPNVHWTLEGGKMTISGSGAMTSWQNANKVPWNNYKSQIKSVVIGDGVTSIGDYAFGECVNIASVSIGKDVKTIYMNAFYKCLSLREVTIPASVETINRDAFANCTSLNKVTVLRPATDEVTKIIGSPFSNTIMATISVYNGLIYVPAGSGETYKAKWPVIYYDNILELIPTYSVKMADGTKDAANWTISDGTTTKTGDEGLDAVAEGQSVTLKYSGRRKVKSVTATTDAGAPAEEPMTLATPLTIEAITDGTIKVKMSGALTTGMKYSVNGGTKTTITSTTVIGDLMAGDKVQFYGNGTLTQFYGDSPEVKILGSGDGFKTKVYGNIMSLLDEEGFATKTDLPNANYVFYGLFKGNTTLTDASELLLPATTLAYGCYQAMFYGCYNLTTAPKLPATELASNCYQQMFDGCTNLTTAPKLPATTLAVCCYLGMFQGCSNLTTAPKLPATTLALQCYTNMFLFCSNLTNAYVKAAFTADDGECGGMFKECSAAGAVLHTTSGSKASWETIMGSGKGWENWTVADDWQD